MELQLFAHDPLNEDLGYALVITEGDREVERLNDVPPALARLIADTAVKMVQFNTRGET
jgi:hypothetical protein